MTMMLVDQYSLEQGSVARTSNELRTEKIISAMSAETVLVSLPRNPMVPGPSLKRNDTPGSIPALWRPKNALASSRSRTRHLSEVAGLKT